MEDEFMLRSKISMSVSAALLLGMVSITGCGDNNSADGNNVQTKNVRKMNDSRINTNSVRGNAFDKMEMSQELADRIAAMPEVRSANVMIAGKSAYVAVAFDRADGGIHAKGTDNIRPYSYGGGFGNNTSGMLTGPGRPIGGMDTGMNTGPGMTVNPGVGRGTEPITGNRGRGSVTGNPGMTGTGGSMAGVPKSLTGTGTVGGIGTANPQAYPGNGNNGILSDSNYVDGTRMKRDIDNSMGTGIGIRSVAPNNSNKMTDDEDVTEEMKDKIAAEVKRYNSGIDNVYVSANPDFVERADFYAQEVRAGHPLKGFANEFRTMVERIFPTRSGY